MNARTPLARVGTRRKKSDEPRLIDRRIPPLLIDGVPDDFDTRTLRRLLNQQGAFHTALRLVMNTDLSRVDAEALEIVLRGLPMKPTGFFQFKDWQRDPLTVGLGYEVVPLTADFGPVFTSILGHSLIRSTEIVPSRMLEAECREVAWNRKVITSPDDSQWTYKEQVSFLESVNAKRVDPYTKKPLPDGVKVILPSVRDMWALLVVLVYEKREGRDYSDYFDGWVRCSDSPFDGYHYTVRSQPKNETVELGMVNDNNISVGILPIIVPKIKKL